MYDEKSKKKTMKYLATSREILHLNLPLGTKDLWKDYAAEKGMSVTELIKKLVEEDMKKNNFIG
jgi:hypothetical protein